MSNGNECKSICQCKYQEAKHRTLFIQFIAYYITRYGHNGLLYTHVKQAPQHGNSAALVYVPFLLGSLTMRVLLLVFLCVFLLFLPVQQRAVLISCIWSLVLEPSTGIDENRKFVSIKWTFFSSLSLSFPLGIAVSFRLMGSFFTL